MAGFSYSSSAIPEMLLTRLSWVVRTMQLPQLPLSYCLQSENLIIESYWILPDSRSQRRKKKLWLARYILGGDHLSLPNSRSSGFLFCLISMEVVCRTQRTGSYDMIMGCIAVPKKKKRWSGRRCIFSLFYIYHVCLYQCTDYILIFSTVRKKNSPPSLYLLIQDVIKITTKLLTTLCRMVCP